MPVCAGAVGSRRRTVARTHRRRRHHVRELIVAAPAAPLAGPAPADHDDDNDNAATAKPHAGLKSYGPDGRLFRMDPSMIAGNTGKDDNAWRARTFPRCERQPWRGKFLHRGKQLRRDAVRNERSTSRRYRFDQCRGRGMRWDAYRHQDGLGLHSLGTEAVRFWRLAPARSGFPFAIGDESAINK